MTMRTPARLVPVAMTALVTVYTAFVTYLNRTSVFALPFLPEIRDPAGHWEGRVLWKVVVIGIALLTLVGIAALLAGRTRLATAFAVSALLLAFITEATGVARARDFQHMQVSVRHLQGIADSLVARNAPLPQSLAGTPHATLSDGWGNAFRYQRLGNDKALIVAANRDGAFDSVPQLNEDFVVTDLDHDVVVMVSRDTWTCHDCPISPPAGRSCRVRSLFGCVSYFY